MKTYRDKDSDWVLMRERRSDGRVWFPGGLPHEKVMAMVEAGEVEVTETPEIVKGDFVSITSQRLTVEGDVISAINYGCEGEPDWYVELRGLNTGRVHYWKQEQDGGTFTVINEVRR